MSANELSNYIITSEDHVSISYTPAGIGVRFFSGFIDTCFQILIFIVVCISEALATDFEESRALIMFILAFAMYWLFPVFFELLLKGRSPGKIITKLQVIDETGRYPNTRQILLRNLLRVLDVFPLMYFTAGICMLKDKYFRRIGDLIAGTVVVYSEEAGKNRIGHEGLWVGKVGQGSKNYTLRLAAGSIQPQTHALLVSFLQRRDKLADDVRQRLAKQIACQIAPAAGEDIMQLTNADLCVQLIERVVKELEGQMTASRQDPYWLEFEKMLEKAQNNLQDLSSETIETLLKTYRQVSSDLSRAQSLGADASIIYQLNSYVSRAYRVLYPAKRTQGMTFKKLLGTFSQTVRKHISAVALAAALFFLPCVVSYFAVSSPEIAYSIVGAQFFDFEPTSMEHMHEIPVLTRPMTSSQIIANDVQVSLSGFASGLTAGIGTVVILLINGIHLGSVAGWMQVQGHHMSLWAWILPHGFTEILAIILSCSAGLLFADALLRRQKISRLAALKLAAKDALIIELGVMGMLLIAGLIEGFISPSSIGFPARIAIVTLSAAFWGWFFLAFDRKTSYIG